MGDGIWQRLTGDGAKGKRSTFLLLALALVGIVLMFVSANPAQERAPAPVPQGSEAVIAPLGGRSDYRERLEKDLEERLRQMKGVKGISVLITLESSPVNEYAENVEISERITSEEDGAGGLREIQETSERRQTALTRDGGGEQALVIREMQPQIRGVLVVAGGADNPLVKEQITHAVEAALRLPAHRIRVLPME